MLPAKDLAPTPARKLDICVFETNGTVPQSGLEVCQCAQGTLSAPSLKTNWTTPQLLRVLARHTPLCSAAVSAASGDITGKGAVSSTPTPRLTEPFWFRETRMPDIGKSGSDSAESVASSNVFLSTS